MTLPGGRRTGSYRGEPIGAVSEIMTKNKHDDTAFHVDTTLWRLFDDLRETTEYARLAENLWSASMYGVVGHMQHHGNGGQHCYSYPCRAGGLSYAMYELLEFRRESNGKVFVAVQALAELRKGLKTKLDELAPRVVEAMEQLSERPGPIFFDEHPESVFLTREYPRELVKQVRGLQMSLESYEQALRTQLWSPQLRRGSQERRGSWLLTATYQHLRWGGYGPTAIAKLRLADDSFGAAWDSARIDQEARKVRDRIGKFNRRKGTFANDERSVRPPERRDGQLSVATDCCR